MSDVSDPAFAGSVVVTLPAVTVLAGTTTRISPF
jgi:hypothetical protein